MKIISIINTSGLIYDDRLLKEVETFKNNKIEVRIIAFEKKNKKGEGFNNSIPYKTLRMLTRRWFPKPKHFLGLKAFEFTFKLFYEILKHRRDILWFHNMEMMGIVSIALVMKKMGYFKGVIWDQHEFPVQEIRKSYAKRIYEWCCLNCDFVIFANESRVKYMETLLPSLKGQISIINNFPTIDVAQRAQHYLNSDIIEWLGGNSYILFQGVAKKGRMIMECSKAVKEIGELKLVIVGPIEDIIRQEIVELFGEEFKERVYVVGMVPQEELYNYLDNCLMSLVFYKNENINNWLCEPNRFYQAMCRKKPIVCGANPPMKDAINKFKCGYALENNDGSDYNEIKKGILYVLNNNESIINQMELIYSKLTWEANEPVFQTIFNRYFDSRK